jgi:hypothetical protein
MESIWPRASVWFRPLRTFSGLLISVSRVEEFGSKTLGIAVRRLGLLLIIVASFLAPSSAFSATKGPGNADYPPDALSKHEQGVVLADVTVGIDGRASDCAVLLSPNSPSLASTTCTMIAKGARFAPAQDRQGNPVQSHALAKITWVIPGCPPPKQDDARLASAASVAVITSLEHC